MGSKHSGAQRGWGGSRRVRWVATYKDRIAANLETCRHCGTRNNLTLAHLIPFIKGGALTFDNTTILCGPCNQQQGPDIWSELISLLAEEQTAPPERRWGLNAGTEAFTRRVQHHTPAPMTRTIGDALRRQT